MKPSLLVTIFSLWCFLPVETAAFCPQTNVVRLLVDDGTAAVRHSSPRKQLTSPRSATTSETTRSSGLEGVNEFDSWYSKAQGSKCDVRIAHAVFGGLRGLMWNGATSAATGSLASVPSSLVLQSDESLPNWDAILASKLWREVLKGQASPFYGYICLLTRGPSFEVSSSTDDSVPRSTAPNALRHWTLEQRKLLSSEPSGQKLIDLDARQQDDWDLKYQGLAAVDRPATREQFRWAMEVVHSRAFRGFDQDLVSSLPGILAPVAAGLMGWAYLTSTTTNPNDAVLCGLGLVAVLPGILNLVSGGKNTVVLLPLIDSANHMESAGSSIEYNPLSNAFELSIQPDCVVPEEDGQQQLYISYGSKGDTELLLNYGFLPGVGSGGADGDDEAARETQRQQLAEAFIARN